MYVDNGTKDVAASEYVRPQTTQAVQLLFAFQSKGTANARATTQTRKQVLDTVTASGLFSTVADTPVANGALLNVTINNIPVTDGAFSKGFATGFTFGLVGSTVTDGYLCTVDYQAAPGAPKLTKSTRHALHTTIGAKGAPPNATKAANVDEAVMTMVRQVVGNALKDLSTDPAFGKQE